MELHKILPSGLVVVETVEPTPALPPPVEPKYRCSSCGAASTEQRLLPLMRRTADGFIMYDPTCQHEDYIVCPACQPKYPGCPVCGCGEEYT